MKLLVFRIFAVFLLVCGLICLVFPLAYLFMPNGPMLVLDTRAYFGGGTSENVPEVRQVNCTAEEYGTNTKGGRNKMRMWNCLIIPGGVKPVAKATEAEPPPGLLYAPIIVGDYSSTTLVRQLPFDRSGDLPTLWNMSGEGDPPLYGVIWNGKELLSRWSSWGLIALLFWGFGIASLWAAKVGWRGGSRAARTMISRTGIQ